MKDRIRLALAGIAIAAGLTASGMAQAGEKLKVAISSTSFAWFPLYVAEGAGLLEKEGLEVEMFNVKDGSVVITAILNGDADVAAIGGNGLFAARAAGQPIKMLTPMNTEFTSNIFGRKDVLEKAGITANSTLEQKVKALKGLKIGVIYFNGAQHTMMKFLFAKYGGGGDIDKVAEIVPIGDAANTLAAMRRGAIDVSVFSPPVPERAIADGYGMMLIDTISGEIPETRGMVYTGMSVTEKTLAEKGKALAAFVRGIDAANKLIQSDIAAAGKAARKHMMSMDSGLYELGSKAMQPASPKSAEVSIEGLKKYRELLAVSGTAYAKGDFDFEASVANDFVRDALAGKR